MTTQDRISILLLMALLVAIAIVSLVVAAAIYITILYSALTIMPAQQAQFVAIVATILMVGVIGLVVGNTRSNR